MEQRQDYFGICSTVIETGIAIGHRVKRLTLTGRIAETNYFYIIILQTQLES